MYGLNEACRKWYNRVDTELQNLGMVKSLFDEALFIYKIDGERH